MSYHSVFRRKLFTCSQLQKDLKERQENQQLVKSSLRDKRMQSARSRRYYEDFQVRMRSKMLRKRTREETVSAGLTCRAFTAGADFIKQDQGLIKPKF